MSKRSDYLAAWRLAHPEAAARHARAQNVKRRRSARALVWVQTTRRNDTRRRAEDTAKAANNRDAWTDTDDRMILATHAEPCAVIAARLGRTRAAIYQRRSRLLGTVGKRSRGNAPLIGPSTAPRGDTPPLRPADFRAWLAGWPANTPVGMSCEAAACPVSRWLTSSLHARRVEIRYGLIAVIPRTGEDRSSVFRAPDWLTAVIDAVDARAGGFVFAADLLPLLPIDGAAVP